jgi:hypothetical protein
MNTKQNLSIEGLVRIAEIGARAALKLGQDLQPVVIGSSRSGPVITSISGEKDDIPLGLRRVVDELKLERYVFVREARITAEPVWCLLLTLVDGESWSYLAAGIHTTANGQREAGRLQPVTLAFDPIRDATARVQA